MGKPELLRSKVATEIRKEIRTKIWMSGGHDLTLRELGRFVAEASAAGADDQLVQVRVRTPESGTVLANVMAIEVKMSEVIK